MKTVESKIIFSAADHLSGTLQRMSQNFAPLAKRIQAVGKNMQELGGQMSFQVSLPIIAGTYALLNPAIAFEKAMADVNKTLGQTQEKLKGTSSDILDMSDELGVANKSIADIYSSASQAGIKGRDNLNIFTRHAAKMGVAFDISFGGAGEILKSFYAQLGNNLKAATSLTDTINLLANNVNTTGANLSEFTKRSLSMGKMFQFTNDEVAAVGATLLSFGIQADVASTSFQNMGKGLLAGASATKGQKEAFKKLGTSAQAVQKNMKVSARGTMLDIFDRLAKLPEIEQFNVIKQLFGLEGLQGTATMAKNIKSLKENIILATNRLKAAGSVGKEYEGITKTASFQTDKFNASQENLRTTLGYVLLPTYIEATKALTNLMEKMRKWAEENPELTNKIVKNTAAIGGMLVVMGPAMWIGGKLIAVFTKLGQTFAKLYGGLKWVVRFSGILSVLRNVKLGILSKIATFKIMNATLTTSSGVIGVFGRAMNIASLAVRGIGIALASSPIGAIITAVLVVGAIAVIKYWEQIKTLFASFAATVSDKLGPTLKGLGETFSRIFEKLSPITKIFGVIYDKIVALFAPVDATKESLDAWSFAGKLIGEVFSVAFKIILNPIKLVLAAIEGFIDVITDIYNIGFEAWIKKMIGYFDGFSFSIKNVIPNIMDIIQSLKDMFSMNMPSWLSFFGIGGNAPSLPKTSKMFLPTIPSANYVKNTIQSPNSTISRLKEIAANQNQNYIPNSVGTDAKFTANVEITDKRTTVVQNTVMNGKTTHQQVKSLNTGKNSPLKAIQ